MQGNFDTYRMVRLAEAPKIDVHLVPSGGKVWGGAGEPATPPIAAAVANAIFAATGKRIRSLPISDHDLSGSAKSTLAGASHIGATRMRNSGRRDRLRPFADVTGVMPAGEARDVTTISRTMLLWTACAVRGRGSDCAGGREYEPAQQSGRISGARRRLRVLPLGARRQGVCRRPQDGSPLGNIYSTNITPDPETGIGSYSLADFDRALRQGIAKDGHRLYPAMPYPSYAKLTDADVAALYDFFMKQVPPVHQANWPNEIPSLARACDGRWRSGARCSPTAAAM